MNELRTAKYSEWLASLMGAGMIAVVLGAWFEAYLPDALLIGMVLVGIALHGWGMYRINQRNQRRTNG